MDLGQRHDWTTLAMVDVDGPDLMLRNLGRIRSANYTDVALLIRDTVRALGRATLVVDATGLGAVVCDLLVRLGVSHVGVSIHGGAT